jgi:DNA-binding Lrp family transcriptional regulator
VITSFVFIQVAADHLPETAQAIADVEGVNEVYSCTGEVDLIARITITRHEDLESLIPAKISKIPGVLSTRTTLAFRLYATRDQEAAFSLGGENGF